VLHRYSEVFRSVLLLSDLLIVGAAWLGAFWLRFFTPLAARGGTPEFAPYGYLLLLILPLWFWLFRARGLYQPRRTESVLPEIGAVIGASAMGVTILMAASFFVRHYYYSRGVIAIFFLLSAGAVIAFRTAVRIVLRQLRRRGYNLRYLLVVGAGRLAEEVIERVHAHPEAGLRVVGALAGDTDGAARSVLGVPVLGAYSSLKAVLRRHRIDQVILAVSKEEADHIEKILLELDDELVTVRLVPDLLHVMTLRSSVDDLDGLPMINLREGPLIGWAGVQKRAFDVAVSTTALLLLSPLLAVLAFAVRLTSGRPVFYAQERMGLDGRVFRMFKFRTMLPGAEDASGPVWTTEKDPRRTHVGSFLRKTSLDELPQLWNVLRGDMSLVGPRPERPVFIEQFRREIPGYMLRHKVKAGCTGWAQVHGWRGNTSLHERVEHDIYYIQNWSLGLDVRILLMTLWRGLLHRNAY